MDLGIRGKTALVCASSKGLGRGCALALSREGVDVTMVARTAATLERAAEEIREETGSPVRTVAADITTDAGRAAALAALGDPDIVVTNAGGPPPGDFRDWDRDAWIAAIDANMLAPIALMRATVDGMMRRGFGRIVNITSSSVKAPIGNLGLSNGARSGLTGFVAGIARETVRSGVTINNILPGAMDTDRLRAQVGDMAKRRGISLDQALDARIAAIPAKRFGTPDEFGALCAFLCSVHAAYITGQNLLIDGGAYPGTY